MTLLELRRATVLRDDLIFHKVLRPFGALQFLHARQRRERLLPGELPGPRRLVDVAEVGERDREEAAGDQDPRDRPREDPTHGPRAPQPRDEPEQAERDHPGALRAREIGEARACAREREDPPRAGRRKRLEAAPEEGHGGHEKEEVGRIALDVGREFVREGMHGPEHEPHPGRPAPEQVAQEEPERNPDERACRDGDGERRALIVTEEGEEFRRHPGVQRVVHVGEGAIRLALHEGLRDGEEPGAIVEDHLAARGQEPAQEERTGEKERDPSRVGAGCGERRDGCPGSVGRGPRRHRALGGAVHGRILTAPSPGGPIPPDSRADARPGASRRLKVSAGVSPRRRA